MKLLKKLDNKQFAQNETVIKRKGILIVDDSRFSRNVLRDILITEGYEVIGEAKDGLEAVEMAKELRPACIFLDVEMPKLDGLGALSKILSNDHDVNVIMCTALGQKKIIIEATKAGAKDYVIKPYRRENIVSILEVIHLRYDDNVIPFQNSNRNQSEITSTEYHSNNDTNKTNVSTDNQTYKTVSEYSQEDVGLVLGSLNDDVELGIQVCKEETLDDIQTDGERLPIYKEFEDIKVKQEFELSNVNDDEIRELLALEVEDELNSKKEIALKEELLVETIQENDEDITSEDDVVNVTALENDEDITSEDDVVNVTALENDESVQITDDSNSQLKNEYKSEFSYLWSNRFDLNQGCLSSIKISLESKRNSFFSIRKADYIPIDLLGQNNTQSWIKLGMMLAYMEKYNNKLSISNISPSFRVSFDHEGNRRLVKDLITTSSEKQDITISELISYRDIISEVDYSPSIQKNKQGHGLYGAISDVVISKHQRRFSDIT